MKLSIDKIQTINPTNIKIPEKFQLENLIMKRQSLGIPVVRNHKNQITYKENLYTFTYIDYEDNMSYEYMYPLHTNEISMVTRITETPTLFEKLCFSICYHVNNNDEVQKHSIELIQYTIRKFDNNNNKTYQEIWDRGYHTYIQLAQYDDKNNLILYQHEDNIMQFEYDENNNLSNYKDNYGNIWNHNMKFPIPYKYKFFQKF